MGITAERMKLVNDFCELASDHNNVLTREDIEEFLTEIQLDELVDIVVETLKKRGVKIISRTNVEFPDFDRDESEDGSDPPAGAGSRRADCRSLPMSTGGN